MPQQYNLPPDIQQKVDAAIAAGAPADQAYQRAMRLTNPGYTGQGFSQYDPNAGLLAQVFRGFAQPIERAAKTSAEAINTLATPGMVKSALGMELEPWEVEGVANYQPKYLKEKELDGRGKILKEGSKTVAGLTSLMIPTGRTVGSALKQGAVEGLLRAYSDDRNLATGALGGAAGQLVSGVVIPKTIQAIKGTPSAVRAALRKGVGATQDWITGAPSTVTPKVAGIEDLVPRVDPNAIRTISSGAAPEIVGVDGKISKIFTNADDLAKEAAHTGTRHSTRARLWVSAFDGSIPARRSADLDPLGTAQQMVDWGISGTPDELYEKASTVTGANGHASKFLREAISQAGEIDATPALKAVDNASAYQLEITSDMKQAIKAKIASNMKSSVTPGKMRAIDAFDLQRQLETSGHEYLNKQTYLQGNVRAQQIGKIYLEAARAMEDQISGAVDTSKILQTMDRTPVYEELYRVSPQMANEFLEYKNVRDLRSFQKYFVRLLQMLELQEQTDLTPAKGLGRSVLRSVFGPVGRLLEPFIGDFADNAATPLITGGAANAFKGTAPQIGQQLTQQVAPKIAGQLVEGTADVLAGGVPQAAQQLTQQVAPTAMGLATRMVAGEGVKDLLPTNNMGLDAQGGQFQTTDGVDIPLTSQKMVTEDGTPIQQINGKYVSMDGMWEWSGTQWVQNQQISPQVLQQAILAQLTSGDKNARANVSTLMDVAKFMYPEGEGVELNTAQMLGRSGLRSLEDMERMMQGDPNLLGSRIPIVNREWDSAVFSTVDAILRLRTGAQAPESEVRSYMNNRAPKLTDPPATKKLKMERLRQDLKDAANSRGGGVDALINQQIQALGGGQY